MIRSTSKMLHPDLRLAVVAGDAVTIARVQGARRSARAGSARSCRPPSRRCCATPAWSLTCAHATPTPAPARRCIEALAEHGIAAHGRSGLNVWVPVREEAPVAGSGGRLCRRRPASASAFAAPPGSPHHRRRCRPPRRPTSSRAHRPRRARRADRDASCLAVAELGRIGLRGSRAGLQHLLHVGARLRERDVVEREAVPARMRAATQRSTLASPPL